METDTAASKMAKNAGLQPCLASTQDMLTDRGALGSAVEYQLLRASQGMKEGKSEEGDSTQMKRSQPVEGRTRRAASSQADLCYGGISGSALKGNSCGAVYNAPGTLALQVSTRQALELKAQQHPDQVTGWEVKVQREMGRKGCKQNNRVKL